MSLKVYITYKEIPSDLEVIYNNKGFFNANTKLKDNEFTRKVLAETETAEYIDENTFNDDMFGVLDRTKLNITAKTLLNLEDNPDKCISLVECDLDCLDRLGDIHDGAVYWPCNCWSYEQPCDIEFRGKKFSDMSEFMAELDRLDMEAKESDYDDDEDDFISDWIKALRNQ